EAAMNPILLKAEDDSSCQVVVMGRPVGSFTAAGYRDLRESLWPRVTAALEDLRGRFDLVVIEGAGSPAEVNLRLGEIVNMRRAAPGRGLPRPGAHLSAASGRAAGRGGDRARPDQQLRRARAAGGRARGVAPAHVPARTPGPAGPHRPARQQGHRGRPPPPPRE